MWTTPSLPGRPAEASCSEVPGRRTPISGRFAGTFGAYVVSDDPDSLHDRAVVAAGAEIIVGPHDTDYGSREFARDPEGNRWSFGTYRESPADPSRERQPRR